LAGDKLAVEITARAGDKLVLVLEETAGFLAGDIGSTAVAAATVSSAGSYGHDLALALQRPEVRSMFEIRLFSEPASVRSIFRAIAKTVSVRYGPIGNLPHVP